MYGHGMLSATKQEQYREALAHAHMGRGLTLTKLTNLLVQVERLDAAMNLAQWELEMGEANDQSDQR